MSWFEIYLWTRLDGFDNFFTFLMIESVILLIVSIIYLIVGKVCIHESALNVISTYYEKAKKEAEEEHKNWSVFYDFAKKFLKYTIISTVTTSFICIMIPTQKEAAMIYVIPKVVNSDIIKQVPNDLGDIYKIGIEELKKVIQGEVKKETKVEKE